MPRKKTTESTIQPAGEPPAIAPAKTSVKRTAKTASDAPDSKIAAPRKPKSAKAVTVEEASVDVAQTEPTVTESAPDVAETKAKKQSPTKAPKPPISKAVTDKAVATVVEAKPSRKTKTAAVAEVPVAEPKAPAKKARSAAKAVPSELDEILVVLEWRPKSATPTKSLRPSLESTGDDERSGRRRRRRGRGRNESPAESQEPKEAAAAESFDPGQEFADLDLPVVFRSREKGAGAPKPAAAEKAAPVAPVVVAPPPLPEKPVRPTIPVPADAPQVILRGGIPTLVKGKKAFPPLFFFGNPQDERRAQTVLEEVALAGDAGIHLHVLFLDLTVDEAMIETSAAEAAYLLAATVKADPNAQVMFRVVFGPDRSWETRFPNARYIGAEGQLCQPSICDDAFWAVAKKCLSSLIKRIRLLPLADRFMGVHLDYAEWFTVASNGYDTSKAALHKFRDWVRARYSNDEVTFRASWFDGRATFDSITVPPYEPEGAEGEKFVRSSRKQRKYVDYHLFLSDATMERVAELAYAVKESSEGYLLCGVSYGYTFEWSHPNNGHLALGKLLRTREVDFIAGPPSYRNREPGGTAPFPGPIDSFALNGKLYISEEDFKTSLSGGHEPDDFNPTIKTPQALDSVQWRGAGAGLAHAFGMCWMDLWGNGWLKTASIWQRGAAIQKALSERMGCELKDPDVIIFIDERALAYLVDPNAFTLLVQNVRESVLRSGLSAGFYLLSDLAYREKFPEAKLYLFLNAWDLRPELRAAIKNRLQRDNKVLFWLYAAGLFDGGRDSLERAREVTGIALKPQPFYSKSGTSVLNKRHPLCEAFPDRGLIGGTKLEPSYFAIPEGSTVLGEYTQTGLPSFVIKEFSGEGDPSLAWKSVFLGEPMVSPALIRALGQLAGAHVYDFQEDLVHVSPPFLTVHCHAAGPRTITLPPNWAAYNLQSQAFVATDGNAIRFTAIDGSSHPFLVGPKAEIESILSLDLDTLLTVDQVPERANDQFQGDTMMFDVPIMKLGDWIEGGLSDEAAEDWLLRPAVVESDAEAEGESSDDKESARPGRRKRRRRGGRGDRGEGYSNDPIDRREGPSGNVSTVSVPDFEMNVTFRKRE